MTKGCLNQFFFALIMFTSCRSTLAGVSYSYNVSGSHFYCRTASDSELNWFRSTGGWDFDGSTACRRNSYSANGAAAGESWNGALPISDVPYISSAHDSSPLNSVFNASMQAVALRESTQSLRIEATYQVSARNYGSSPVATSLTGAFSFSGEVEFFPASGEIWAIETTAGSGVAIAGTNVRIVRRVSLSEGELLLVSAGEGRHVLSAGNSLSVTTARGASSGQGHLLVRAIALNPIACASVSRGSLRGDWTSQNALAKICGFYRGYSDLPHIAGRSEHIQPLNDVLGFFALGQISESLRGAIAEVLSGDLAERATRVIAFSAIHARNPLVRAWQRRAHAAMGWYRVP